MSAEKRIFVEGFSSGILSGIAIKTGISVDEGSIMTMVMKSFCQATEGIQSSFNCWEFVSVIYILALLGSGIAIYEAVTNADDWKIGAFIYVVGFIIGLLLIVIFA